jgi:chromosome segregation ATPase|tara:strand:- start:5135 stop:5389 length:255 start_codon:yes stop_codon:yes gene_type:complete
MEKKIVLDKKEISKLKELRQNFTNLTNTLGNLEIQIMNLNIQKESLKETLLNLQKEEIVLAKELETKYGEGSISLDSGEFLPIK